MAVVRGVDGEVHAGRAAQSARGCATARREHEHAPLADVLPPAAPRNDVPEVITGFRSPGTEEVAAAMALEAAEARNKIVTRAKGVRIAPYPGGATPGASTTSVPAVAAPFIETIPPYCCTLRT